MKKLRKDPHKSINKGTEDKSSIMVYLISVILILLVCYPVTAELANEGMDLYAAGKYDDAIKWFENTLNDTVGIERAPLLNNIGASYLAQGRTNEAISKFKEALEANPAYGVSLINLGVSNELIGNTEEALQNYDKTAEVDMSNAPKAMIKKGTLLTVQGKYDDAIAAYKKVEPITKDIDLLALYTGMGSTYYLMKDYSHAEEAFNKAIKADPDNAYLTYYDLGVLKVDQGNYEEAKTALKESVEKSQPGFTKATDLLAKIDELEANISKSSS